MRAHPDFMRWLPGRSVEAREELVLEAGLAGLALPIVWAPLATSAGGHTGTIHVATDTLRFGVPGPNADPSDRDWVRVAVTADTAQRIADTLGVLLPTDRIADLAHAQADVRLTPHPQTPVTATAEAMLGTAPGGAVSLPPARRALNPSSRWNTVSGSTHETSSLVDTEDTGSPFGPFADLRRSAWQRRRRWYWARAFLLTQAVIG